MSRPQFYKGCVLSSGKLFYGLHIWGFYMLAMVVTNGHKVSSVQIATIVPSFLLLRCGPLLCEQCSSKTDRNVLSVSCKTSSYILIQNICRCHLAMLSILIDWTQNFLRQAIREVSFFIRKVSITREKLSTTVPICGPHHIMRSMPVWGNPDRNVQATSPLPQSTIQWSGASEWWSGASQRRTWP